MALAEPGAGDADEPGVLHLLDRRRAAVAHRLAQPAGELVEDVRDRALVRDPALDTFGDQLVDVLDVALEVAVLRVSARLHRAERAHASVLLEALTAREDHLARSLVGAREQAAGHHRVGPGCDGLGNIAGGVQPAVAYYRHAVRLRGARAVVDRRHLRNADPRDHPRGADRPRPDPHLDRI